MKAENGEIINSFTHLLNYIYKNMAQTINQRIDALRALLKREGIDAFIIPSTDPHLSEYVAPYWKSREWISGFTGSAGTAVITSDKAGLWTDSRYFLQAEQQLEGSGTDLYKEMLPETPSILDPAGEPYSEFSCRYRRKGIFHHTSHSPARGSGKKRHHRKEHCRPDE